MSNAEVASRHRRVQIVLAIVYVGIPAVFLGVVLWIGSAASPFAWQGAVVPVAMLVVGIVLLRRHRYKPQRWAGVGA